MTTTNKRPKGVQGRRLGYIPPGSDEWKRYMTGSKIAAVMGHSEFESKFALWHRMAGTIPAKTDNDEFKRGHLLEPAICNWWQTQHPEGKLYRSGMYQHRDLSWAAATPDRIVRYGDGREPELIEAKSANNGWEWGDQGTDEIPPGYYDQAIWQLGVTGLTTCHVPVLTGGLQFRSYVVTFNPDRFNELVEQASEFMRTLHAGEKPPLDPLDGHMDTYKAIRYLHPDIELDTVEVTQALAMQAQCAVLDKDEADKKLTALKSKFTDLMGTAKDAVFDGKKIARRQAKGDGTPFVVFPPSLKKADLIITEKETAA